MLSSQYQFMDQKPLSGSTLNIFMQTLLPLSRNFVESAFPSKQLSMLVILQLLIFASLCLTFSIPKLWSPIVFFQPRPFLHNYRMHTNNSSASVNRLPVSTPRSAAEQYLTCCHYSITKRNGRSDKNRQLLKKPICSRFSDRWSVMSLYALRL